MDKITEAVIKYWAWLSGGALSIFGLGVARSKIVTKKELYNPDGTQIYLPKSEFIEKIDSVQISINKIENRDKEQTRTLTDIAKHMGAVEQYMKDH